MSKRRWIVFPSGEIVPEIRGGIEPVTTAALIAGGAAIVGSAMGKAPKSAIPIQSTKRTNRMGLELFQSLIAGGIPGFEGDLSAPLGEGEQNILGLIPSAGQTLAGFFDPNFGADLLTRFETARRPFVERQIELGKSSLRESESLGGTLFSTGRIQRESDLTRDIFASEQAQAAPLAAQLSLAGPQLQLQAAGQLPGLLGAAGLPRQIEQDAINRELAEFIRTSPQALLPYILQLITGSAGPQPQQQSALTQAAPALAGLSGGLFNLGAAQQTPGSQINQPNNNVPGTPDFYGPQQP